MEARDLQLFDQFGNFALPSDDDIAKLSAEDRERFEAVRIAADENAATAAAAKAARQRLTDALAGYESAQKDLRELRPPLSPVEAARQWMQTQRSH